jgi:hypothetical protein
MRAEGVSFRHAVELLQNEALPTAPASASSPLAASSAVSSTSAMPAKRSTTRKLAPPLEREAEDAKLLVQVIDYYHQVEVKPTAVTVSEAEREAALELLKSPDLLTRIADDFAACGIVGERTNALVGYLSAVSRKLDRPLALLIQSTSAAGKSSLLDAVLRFVPEEDRIVYSAMTGQSLFYMGEMNLKHKLLAIAEEEGAHRASYALKLLQSEGELTIASTSKDATTGKLVTEEYHVEGPVMLALTTTAAEIDEELLNRCLPPTAWTQWSFC